VAKAMQRTLQLGDVGSPFAQDVYQFYVPIRRFFRPKLSVGQLSQL
jgi:hypothetical protein